MHQSLRANKIFLRANQGQVHPIYKYLSIRKNKPKAVKNYTQRLAVELVERQPLNKDPALVQAITYALELLYRQQGAGARQVGMKDISDYNIIPFSTCA